MRLTKKLLSLLHRVFDKDPGKFLAFRLTYQGGMTWRVADAVLTTTVTGGPGQGLRVDLSQYTLGELYNYLAAQPGYSLPYGDYSDLSLLSARVLMDGNGDIDRSNGDHLYGYTSVLWSYMEAQANELQQAEVQIGEMLKQMSTKTARNEWLDEIGSYYAVPRLQGELDNSYGPRIIAEVLRPRGNNVAMEAAIKIFTGQDTKVTDVTEWGPTFPLYNNTIRYNGVYRYNASAEPIYGLFDVDYGYDFENGADIVAFQGIVRDLINRLRDAGTHLRSLLLRGSDMSDTFAPPTDGGDIGWQATSDLADTLTVPTDSDIDLVSTLSEFTDTFAGSDDGDAAVLIFYNYRYNAIRRRDGKITYLGSSVIVENIGQPGSPAGSLLTLDGSWALNGTYTLSGLK